MPIVFNFLAIVQLIISVIVLALVHFLLNLFGADVDLLGGTKETVVTLLILCFVTAYTEIKGLKGSLFWLPAWFFIMIFTVGYYYTFYESGYGVDGFWGSANTLWIGCLIILAFYLVQGRKSFEKKWAKQKVYLSMLKEGVESNELDRQAFWQMASHVFYKPPAMYRNFYTIWKPLFRDAIPGQEFYEYYKEFIGLVNIEEIPKEKRRKWMTELRDTLNEAKDHTDFIFPPFGWGRLATTIDYMNEISQK